MSSLHLRLEELKAAQPLTGTSLYFETPEKGRGVGRSGTAILLPEPVQFGEELALVKELLQVCFGRIGTAGAKCCLKTIAKCDTESHERTKCTIPEHSSFLSNFTDRTKDMRTQCLMLRIWICYWLKNCWRRRGLIDRVNLRQCVSRGLGH